MVERIYQGHYNLNLAKFRAYYFHSIVNNYSVCIQEIRFATLCSNKKTEITNKLFLYQ